MRKLRILPLLLAVLLLALVGCDRQGEADTVRALSDFADREANFGIPSDILLEDRLREICPRMTLTYYDDFLLGIEAVRAGKIDGYVCGRNYFEDALASGNMDGLRMLEESVYVYYCGLGLSDEAPVADYENRVNACIAQMEADGTMDEMRERWFGEEIGEMPDIEMPDDPDYTLRVVTFGKEKPYSFLKDGMYTGFDVELAYRVAAYLNCDITLETAEYSSMLMGLSAGKYDMISANLYISEDRSDNVIYSDPYNSVEIAMAVRDNPGETFLGGFAETVSKGLRSTFVEEGRWRLILSGLGTTMLITVLGFALATVLGGVFCALAMSKRKLCHILADIYSRIMQGTPMVVVLMILFYVVFGHSSISAVTVSIFGFGLASGATLAQQFQGAITSVAKGQREASLALGFTKRETFTGIVLPQALRRLLPGYFSELIALMKGTAIVGYVAVTDLTKASDLIRGATYDAFFPLISVAVIYFAIAFLLLGILKRIQKRLAPKRLPIREVTK